MFPVKLRRFFKVAVLVSGMLVGLAGFVPIDSWAATPPNGSISNTTTNSTSWQGQFYPAATVAVPDQCPPSSIDVSNAVCDHFNLNLTLVSDFWTTHSGSVSISINWTSSDNDFDLYIYRLSDGQQVGSSAAGGTTSEQVVLQSPTPGVYEVRVVPFLVIASDYTGSASLFFTNTPPTPNPTFPTGGIVFGPATIGDPQRTEGEPLNHIDKYGNIWETGPWGFSTAQGFVHKSTDGGDSFHIVSPSGLRPNPAPFGGGDTDIITDDQGFAYFADLEGLADIGVAVSNDGGNIWRANFFTAQPLDDRQWLAIDNGLTPGTSDNTVFLAFNQLAFGWEVLSSPGSTGATDFFGGLVYSNAASTNTVSSDDRCGRLLFDPVNRMLYLPCNSGDHVNIYRAYVPPGQQTGLVFRAVQTPASPGGQIGLGRLFSDVAADTAGNIYAVWVDINNNNVYMSSAASAGTSTGNRWTSPVQVNGDPANSNVMPWAIGGGPGEVDIAFYGTDVRGDPNTFPSWYNNRVAATGVKWFVYFVQVNGATSATPTIYQVRASEHPTDYGQICTGGLGCTLSGGDRTLADFFTLAIDANGAARIVVNDLTNQHHGAAIFHLTQLAGPSAYGTTLKNKTVNPTNSVTDSAGDSQLPHYSPAGAGPNQSALDLLSVKLSQPDLSHLTVTLKLQNLASLFPPTGATGILWLTRWQFLSVGDGGEESYRIFYLGASSTGGQNPVYFAGTGTSAMGPVPGDGCVTTTPENCKVVKYPAQAPATGSINAATNMITITAALWDIGSPIKGDTLYSVTALTFGATSGDPIMMDADAARAFDYVLGQTILPTNCPLGTSCKVTGGGYIFVDPLQDRGQFSIEVKVDSSGRVTGKAAYRDTVGGVDFRTTIISQVQFNGNTVTIKGTGLANGMQTSFIIRVQDNAEPGAGSDTFSIQLGTGYSKSGVLQGGNIQAH